MTTTMQHRPGNPEAAQAFGGAKAIISASPRPCPTCGHAEPSLARLAALSARLGSMARRLLEDVLLAEAHNQRVDGLPSTWLDRADGYDRAGDTERAAACRERAELIRRWPDDFGSAAASIREAVADALLEQGVL